MINVNEFFLKYIILSFDKQLLAYRHGQNRVTDLKGEGESLGIAAAGGLMLLLWDMKEGREVQITAKINNF